MSSARLQCKSSRRGIRRVATNMLAASLLVTASALAADAQPKQSFELEWNSPSSCPQQFDVTEQIRTMLGAAPGATLPSGLHAEGELEPVGERFRLTLTIRLGQIERSRVIESNDCTSLGKAAAVVLGLLIRREHESGKELTANDLGSDFASQPPADPSNRDGNTSPETNRAAADGDAAPTTSSNVKRNPGSTEAEPSLAPTEPAPKSRETSAPSQTRDAPTKSREPFVHLLAPTGSVDFWTSPGVDLGLGIGLGVDYASWRGIVAGTLWKEQQLSRGTREPYQATFSRKGVEAWWCRILRQGILELLPCVVGALDFVGANASGSRLKSHSTQLVLPSIGAGMIGSAQVVGPLRIFLAASGRIATRRPEFQVQLLGSLDDTHIAPFGTVVTTIGSEWIF